MTEAQAGVLWDAARALHAPARIVEIGSYRGRSAIVLALAAADGVEVVAIDPHAGNDRGPQQIRGSAAEGDADHKAFMRNLSGAGVARSSGTSACLRRMRWGSVDGEVDLLYIDGAHRYSPAARRHRTLGGTGRRRMATS